jgi:hypothetical protein
VRSWRVEPALDTAQVRNAWIAVLTENPALRVQFTLSKQGFWAQTPDPARQLDSYVIEAPGCDARTRAELEAQNGVMKRRVSTLVIDNGSSSHTDIHMYIDHVVLDGHSFNHILGTFSEYLAGKRPSFREDQRFFSYCSEFGGTSHNTGPLDRHPTVLPFESIPGSLEPESDRSDLISTETYEVPLDRLTPFLQIGRLAGLGGVLTGRAISATTPSTTIEIPTVVTVPGRRPQNTDVVGRHLGYAMITIPTQGCDIYQDTVRLYNRMVAASKHSVHRPISRITAATAPHRSAAKYKSASHMLPYMIVNHEQAEIPLRIRGRRVVVTDARPTIYLGACSAYSSTAGDSWRLEVAIKINHLNRTVFEHITASLETLRLIK